jgi:oligopeptide transport system substrate-binding protein
MFTRWSYFLLIPLCLLTLTACRQDKPLSTSQSTLRVSCEGDAQTLDPRYVRNLSNVTAIHMLYEGLMRNHEGGELIPALAETVDISPDQKTYTFKLRRSAWSDGQLVTAYDFEETWKSVLDPSFPSPNAYQLYPLKGAQAAKEGRAPVEHVGVQALDESTLLVTLEQPTPYFLHLTATYFYYPVHASLRKQAANPVAADASDIVTNGPFKLERWKQHNELTSTPNPHYWDRDNVRLDRIALIVLDNSTALQAFQRNELEWTGSPLSTIPTDALASFKQGGQLEIVPAAATYLLRFNTERAPFNNVKIRHAFTLALNRGDLVEHVLQGNQEPAFGLVPPSFLEGEPFFKDYDVERARQLFQEALAEEGLSADTFPQVSIHYATGERSHKIAQVAQQHWKDVLGIHVNLQSTESKVYYDLLQNKEYQIGIGSWFADIRDPISFLEVFKFKENGTNNTQWENPRYIALLDESGQATTPQQREKLLKEAEWVLVQDMPVAPLFYSSYNYVKHPKVQGIYFSELGYLDFKKAHFEQ